MKDSRLWEKAFTSIDFCRKLARAGFIGCYFGLESASQRVNNLMNRLPLTASSLYAKNLFSFIRNLFSKEKNDFNINLEDEIIEKTLIKGAK